MKKLLVVLSILLLLVGCSQPQTEPEPVQPVEQTDVLANKAFYNLYDECDTTRNASVQFLSDGTFEMYDQYLDGFVEFKGTYKIEDNVVTLDVTQCGLGDYKEVKFELLSEKSLLLRTDLFNSKKENLFYIDKTEGKCNIETQDKIFYNASQAANGAIAVSSLVLVEEDGSKELGSGSFTLNEIQGLSGTEINGTYGRQGDVLMFSFDDPLYSYVGERVYNFEFRVINDDTLELMRDLEFSFAGDCFSTDGTIPSYYVSQIEEEKKNNVTVYMSYTHEEIEGVNKEYLPSIYLYSDNTFEFVKNCYAGMGSYLGTYDEYADKFVLTVTDASQMQGFAGQDVKEIILDKNDGLPMVILKTELCMCRVDDVFNFNFE